MNCPICSDDLTLENTVNTECNHTFCKKCFWKWTKKNNSCSLCRSPILINTNDERRQEFISRMIEQRRQLSRQIHYWTEKVKNLKNEANRLGIVLNKNTNQNTTNQNTTNQNNNTVFISTPELNRITLESIYYAIVNYDNIDIT